jgi:hypothetical protein
MKLTHRFLTIVCSGLLIAPVSAQTVIESFEYPTTEDLQAVWLPSANAIVSSSDSVAPSSTGTKSMRVEFSFPSTAFTTEFVNGSDLPAPIAIDPTHYVSFRVKGDPAFASADFRHLYLYAYDVNGNFGRWGAAVPSNDQWHIVNYLASTVEKPWNSTELPDLTQIVRFAFYQYGSESAIPAYTAAINVDDVTVRETPLVEQPTGPIEQVIDAFEYADAESILASWSPSANATLAPTTAISGRATGTTAMEATFNFPSTAWATEIINGTTLTTPISIASTQYVSFRIKGDPAFSAADFRNLYLYVYDSAGNFGRWGGEVPTTADWQIVNRLASTIEKPWDSPALPDLSNIVRFAWFQYGSETAIPAYTAKIALDELQVRNTLLVDAPISPDTIVEDFEYTSDEIATSFTTSANAVVSGSEDISHNATGTNSLQVIFNFPSTVWATETVRGPDFETPISIAPGQYITFRVKGDPAFAATDFKNLYLYIYDADGNFGRWGAPVPTTADWKVFNFAANSIEKPWDSPALPNLGAITRYAFFQYGSETMRDAYSATIYLDEVMVRNSPLNEFPAPAATRAVIENFESYTDEASILAAYAYVNSPAATTTAAAVESPAPEGSKALKLTIDFSAGQYPWGSIRSVAGAPFSFPTNGVLSVRFKGDPTLASVADAGTSFWISFYDASGRAINYIVPSSVVTNGDWTALQANLGDFGDTAAVDIGNLVQWRILVQAWEGTAESTPASATFYVDDIRIGTAAVQPSLTVGRNGNSITISWPESVTGYTLESATAISGAPWQTVTGVANNQATVAIEGSARFFRLRQ